MVREVHISSSGKVKWSERVEAYRSTIKQMQGRLLAVLYLVVKVQKITVVKL